MNQPQREFLIKHIERHHKKAIDDLNKTRPRKPSLNNYLIAAVLAGSFKLQSEESIRDFIRALVLSLGPDGALVKGPRRHYDDDDDVANTLTLPAEQLFTLPAEYLSALESYNEAERAWQSQIDQTNEIKDTLILKIQIGSAKVLEKLVEQVDNLADLQLVNTRLLLTE